MCLVRLSAFVVDDHQAIVLSLVRRVDGRVKKKKACISIKLIEYPKLFMPMITSVVIILVAFEVSRSMSANDDMVERSVAQSVVCFIQLAVYRPG